jgi:hypothetical protein
MTDPSSRRKLAAILSADVVGYSCLMAANEAATVETLKAYRDIIIRWRLNCLSMVRAGPSCPTVYLPTSSGTCPI